MMGKKVFWLCLLFPGFFIKDIQCQITSITPLLSMNGIGPKLHASALSNLPTVGFRTAAPMFPVSGLPAFSAFGLQGLAAAVHRIFGPAPTNAAEIPTLFLSKCDSKNVPTSLKSLKTTDITSYNASDKDVLNNLAIALQLLIVSNLLKTSKSDLESDEEFSLPKLFDSIHPQYLSSGESLLQNNPITLTKISNFGSSSPLTSMKFTPPNNAIPPSVSSSIDPVQMSRLSTQFPQTSQLSTQLQPRTPVKSVPISEHNPQVMTPISSLAQMTSSPQSSLPSHTICFPEFPQQRNQDNPMRYTQPYRTASSVTQESSPQTFLPSANFVDSPNFNAPLSNSFFNPSGVQSTRNCKLMSPYEAIENYPFKDPILSSPFCKTASSTRNIQSPYASILDDDVVLFPNNLFT